MPFNFASDWSSKGGVVFLNESQRSIMHVHKRQFIAKLLCQSNISVPKFFAGVCFCSGRIYSKFCINCFWTLLQAITEIQAALRGQAVRSKYIEKLDKELELTDRDDAIVAIQSAMRAHLSRKTHAEEPGYELTSRDFRTRGR